MTIWMKSFAVFAFITIVGSGCGRDEKSSAERDAEIQRTLQEGAQKERKMYEGMQKGVENLEKSTQEQKEKGQK